MDLRCWRKLESGGRREPERIILAAPMQPGPRNIEPRLGTRLIQVLKRKRTRLLLRGYAPANQKHPRQQGPGGSHFPPTFILTIPFSSIYSRLLSQTNSTIS